MKRSRSEGVYFFLTILVIIASATIYFLYGHDKTTSLTTSTSSQITSMSKEQDIIDKATAAIESLENNPQQDAIEPIQELLVQISDDTNKDELQARLDAVATELTHQTTAETAVTQAETLQTQDSVDTAQSAINAVSNVSKKAELQSRLDTVSNTINSINNQASVETTSAYYETNTAAQYNYDDDNIPN